MDRLDVVEAFGLEEPAQLARPDAIEAEEERRGDAEAIPDPVRAAPERGRLLENPVVEPAAPLVEARMDQLAEVIDHGGHGAGGPELARERLRHAGMAGAIGGGEDEHARGRGRHGFGRLATSRVSRPSWVVSSCWLTMRRSSTSTPPSRRERFVFVTETLRIVSPTRRGRRKRHSNPMKARTTRGGRGTRHPSPEERQRGRRSGTRPSSRALTSSVSPVNSVTWAAVIVIPGVSRGTSSST